jgi:cytochrome bd-type quinol oxidase subunit 2
MLIITACLLTFIAFLLLPTGVLVYLVVAGPVVGVGYLLMLIGKSGRGKHGSSEPGEM